MSDAVKLIHFLFIDDREDNIAVARSAGINAICFRNAAQLREELTTVGVLRTTNRAEESI